MMTSATTSQRRALTLDRDPLGAEPSLELLADGAQPLGGSRLEAHHEHRLRIRRAEQPPSIAEAHTRAVDIHHLVLRLEVPHRVVDHLEHDLLRDVYAE